MLRVPVLVLPLLALIGCAQTPAQTARAAQAEQAVQDKLAARLAGFTPGARTSCLPLTVVSGQAQTQGYGSTILYVSGRNVIYRNDTTGGCENIARGDILVTRQPQGRACQGDIATTVEPTSRTFTGSCGLGEFTVYKRAP